MTEPDLGGRMSLMEHLVELRSRLIKCFVAVALGAVAGWLLYEPMLEILMEPLQKLSDNPNVSADFISFDPLEQFMLRIKMSTYLGLALAMPFLLWQLWQFIAPGLYQNERRYAGAFVFSATVLFAMGAAIAYYTLPEALGFLQSVGGDNVEYQYTAENYLMLILYMMLAFGVGFQFPIVIVFLQLIGLVEPQQLAKFRRFAVVIIFAAAAVITPSADPISLVALALPMVLFYEISILIGRLIGRRRRRTAG
ncbi:MAG: twin-arginine translocase subunit TatC [Acidimicrobiales bacterium]|nr:twin-arginine translocase subunit TatC [Acidimicrobiales bacterium]HMS87464.1 twin-arginine translocase subunit TatC [Acidimicrobiales bacterium]